MQRPCGNKSLFGHPSERGMVKAPCAGDVSHFRVARDDRDGCSRYRAAKISCDCRIIRVVPRFILAPNFWGEVYFFEFQFGGYTNESQALWCQRAARDVPLLL